MSVNKAIILGRLGQSPELRYTNTGKAVCKFSVATGKKYINNSGETVNETQWHRIVVWGKQAENANTYLKKGSQVYIEGEIKTSSYEKEGQKHWATDIHANVMQFIGEKASSDSNSDDSSNSDQNSNQNKNKNKNQNKNQNQPPENPSEPSFEGFNNSPGDDDIPF